MHDREAWVHVQHVLTRVATHPEQARELRALLARRDAVAQDQQRERNRFENTPERVHQRMLAKGKSKMSEIGAAMHKLAHLCFGVVHTGQP